MVMMCMMVFIINALSIIQRGPLKNLSVRIIPFCTSGLVQAYWVWRARPIYMALSLGNSQLYLQESRDKPYNAHLLLFLSFVGFYIVRGNFEQVDIAQIGIITGFLLALRNR